MPLFSAADEGQHPDVAVEAWWWWGWNEERSVGWFVGFELRGRRYDYWAGLARRDRAYLYLAELDGADRRAGLEIKPPELWADHVCDQPFVQWSVANEGYAVLLDDPNQAWHRAYGERVPVAFDIEWAAHGDPQAIAGGYRQDGEFDAVIELRDGPLRLLGPAQRVHCWGAPFVPSALAAPVDALRAPYRRSDDRRVDQVLGSDGWHGRIVAE